MISGNATPKQRKAHRIFQDMERGIQCIASAMYRIEQFPSKNGAAYSTRLKDIIIQLQKMQQQVFAAMHTPHEFRLMKRLAAEFHRATLDKKDLGKYN